MDFGLSAKVYAQLNACIDKLKRDGEAKATACANLGDAKLPRKASRANYIGACTENRHRWSRREF